MLRFSLQRAQNKRWWAPYGFSQPELSEKNQLRQDQKLLLTDFYPERPRAVQPRRRCGAAGCFHLSRLFALSSAAYYSRLIQMIPNIFIPGFCIYEVSPLLPVIESLAGGMHICWCRCSIWYAISSLIRIKWAKKRSIKYQRCHWGFVSYLWKFMFSAVKVSASLPRLTWQPRHRRGDSLRPLKSKMTFYFAFWKF